MDIIQGFKITMKITKTVFQSQIFNLLITSRFAGELFQTLGLLPGSKNAQGIDAAMISPTKRIAPTPFGPDDIDLVARRKIFGGNCV
jgi:hypothetical protein